MITEADPQPERRLHAVQAVCTCLSAAKIAERRASLRCAAAWMAARTAQQQPHHEVHTSACKRAANCRQGHTGQGHTK